MDPTSRFFTKLRKLSVMLEAETAELQEAFDNRDDDDADDSETTTKAATRAFHQVNGDIGSLKEQIRGQVAQQKAQVYEVSSFIKACRVMQQRVGNDIQTLKGHWENYGYQAPQDPQRETEAKGQESEEEVADENETKSSTGGEGESQEEAGGSLSSSTPPPGPPPSNDPLRTPRLSDFGLCEIQMKRALAGWCSEVPPMPEMSIPPPSLNTPALPPLLLTPKRALRMDDDELQTPQMSDFGISEHTMCLNNDFTMDLLRKNVEKPQRPPEDMPVPPVNALMESLHTQAQNLESPEPPVFCTPGLKIKKTKDHCSPPAQSSDEPEPLRRPGILPDTPEFPIFLNPHLNKLFSIQKSARQPEALNMPADEDTHTFGLPSPRKGATGCKRPWECDVPDVSITGVEDMQMPEMPKLESPLKSAKVKKKTVNDLDLDGPTQEFCLATPRIRMDYQQPSTPEMPDLSSVTQDICRLLPPTQLKKPPVAVVHPNTSSAVRLSEVSEIEFQSLPKYLRQITALSNLNQAVHSINTFTEQSRGERTEFQMEELKRICLDETKTPVYVLCLSELKRLEYVRGTRNMSVYKLCSHK